MFIYGGCVHEPANHPKTGLAPLISLQSASLRSCPGLIVSNPPLL